MSSEKKCLDEYRINNYERPSVTTDIVVFAICSEGEDNYRHDPQNRLLILLIKRRDHPFRDDWTLPGGFLRPTETVDDCATREITEETNVTPASLMPIGVFSEPGWDPQGWIISNTFASVIS